MTGGLKTRPEIHNLAQMLERLGGVSLERIRFHPAPGTATVKDVLAIERREDRLYELVDGILVEKGMGFLESRIASLLIAALQNFADQQDLGVVTGESGMIRMPENLVRIPDAAFFAWDKFPGREIPQVGAPRIVPDLAVEVLSKSNTKAEMARKLGEYFSSGVRLVWFVDPQTRTVSIYTSPTRIKVLTAASSLDGGRVLPGFKLPVEKLFENLARRRRK